MSDASSPRAKPTREFSTVSLAGGKKTVDNLLKQTGIMDVDTNGRAKVNMLSPGAQYLCHVLLGSSSTLIFTATKNYADVRVFPANVDAAGAGGMRLFTLYHLFQTEGSTVGDINTRCKNRQLLQGASQEDMILIPGMGFGQTLYGLCDSANKVAVSVFGVPLDQ